MWGILGCIILPEKVTYGPEKVTYGPFNSSFVNDTKAFTNASYDLGVIPRIHNIMEKEDKNDAACERVKKPGTILVS
jgi:hypothetical protein